jgi:hypothetical protein
MGTQIITQPQTFKNASTVIGATAGLSAVAGLTVYGDIGTGPNIITGLGTTAGDCAIELGGFRTGDGNAYIDFHAATAAGVDYNARIIRGPGTNGNFYIGNAGSGGLQIYHEGPGPVQFGTNNAERMRIDASGNVGIGQSAPEAKFNVAGASILGAASDGYAFFAVKPGTTAFGANYDRVELFVNPNSQVANFGTTNGGTGSARALAFLTGNAERIRIDTTGNVGIGTTTPSQLLTVSKTQAGASTIVKVENVSTTNNSVARFDMATGSANSYGIIALTETSTGNYTEWSSGAGVTGGTYITSGTTSAPIVFRQSSSSERMRIDASGNVGIGTSSPGAKLDVNGAARSTQHEVNNSAGNWRVMRYSSSGAARWDIGATNVAETGSNVGSDFIIHSFADNGAFLDRPFYISRATSRVGIGTSTPGYKLDVAGNIKASEEIIVSNTSNANQLRLVHNNYGLIQRNDGSTFYFLPTNSGDQYGSWNALRPFYFNMASGDVGMNHNVTIGGSLYITGEIKQQNSASSLDIYTGTVFNSGGAAFVLRGTSAGYNNGGMEFYTGPGPGNGTERMRIDASGNVGIGTTSPSQKLTVVGDISASGTIYGTTHIAPSVTIATGNGTQTDFVISGFTTTTASRYMAFLDGVAQRPTTDFTITSTSGGTISFIPAPSSGVLIMVYAL